MIVTFIWYEIDWDAADTLFIVFCDESHILINFAYAQSHYQWFIQVITVQINYLVERLKMSFTLIIFIQSLM